MKKSTNQHNKELIWDLLQQLNHTDASGARDLLLTTLHPEIAWFGPHPLNQLAGLDEVASVYWEPLLSSFEGLRHECHVFLGSESCGEYWVSACGYLSGRFVRDWLGIPATGRQAHIHFGEHSRLEHERIVESYLILDIPAVMRQSGFHMFPPARGAEGGRVIGPPRGEGVLLMERSELESRQSRQLVWAMIRALDRSGGDINKLGNENYWHPDMHWYGPTGIGSCYGLEQYNEFHAIPWARAFPDEPPQPRTGRLIGLQDGEILAEGNYAALGVWDYAFSAHRGEFLNIPATGKPMTMRDFDWYRRDGRYLVQNWVPIDLIDIYLQLGIDLMHELAHERERRDVGEPARAVGR